MNQAGKLISAAVTFGISMSAASAGTDAVHVPSLHVRSSAAPGGVVYEKTETPTVAQQTVRTTAHYEAKFGALGVAKLVVPAGTLLTIFGDSACAATPLYRTVAGVMDVCFKGITTTKTFSAFTYSGNGFSGGYNMKKPLAYEDAETSVRKVGKSFKQSVSYLGSAAGTLKLSYREFTDDMARPAFTDEISYSTPARFPDVIAFRSLRIKVYSISNAGIDYEVETGL